MVSDDVFVRGLGGTARCCGAPPRLARRVRSPCSLWRCGTLREELLWGAVDHHGLGEMGMIVRVVLVGRERLTCVRG